MKFKGRGIVKWKDRTLVNFEEYKDGILETMDERIIQRLKMVGFEEYKEPKQPDLAVETDTNVAKEEGASNASDNDVVSVPENASEIAPTSTEKGDPPESGKVLPPSPQKASTKEKAHKPKGKK